MYQPGSHRRKVIQDFSSTFLLRCMPYFPREKDSVVLSLVDREIEFCVHLRFDYSPLVGHFIFIFTLLVKKNSSYGIRTHVPTCQKVTRLPTELPGRPVYGV